MTETTLDDLHGQIMGLQALPTCAAWNTSTTLAAERAYYSNGHRDARHAAAELVAAVRDAENETTERQKESVAKAPGVVFNIVRDCVTGWEWKEQEPKSNASSKRYSHPHYGTGRIVKLHRDIMGAVLLYLDVPCGGIRGEVWVDKRDLTEIPEVCFEPEEAKHLNSIADALGLPDLSEYKSKAQMLSNIHSRICENSSLVKKAALTLGFVSKD